jgi:hypothetical protein
MAAGEGIRRAAGLGPFAITDVCPMLAYSVGAGIPEGLDGVLPLALFEPSFLKSHPPGVAGSAAMRASAGDGVPVPSDEENSDLLERLRAMGYVE